MKSKGMTPELRVATKEAMDKLLAAETELREQEKRFQEAREAVHEARMSLRALELEAEKLRPLTKRPLEMLQQLKDASAKGEGLPYPSRFYYRGKADTADLLIRLGFASYRAQAGERTASLCITEAGAAKLAEQVEPLRKKAK